MEAKGYKKMLNNIGYEETLKRVIKDRAKGLGITVSEYKKTYPKRVYDLQRYLASKLED